MIQYPKHEHITLPSVESWNTNMNILRDPPKAVWTRKIDKVSETQEITRMIGEDSGDRICEMIKVYPRGINPHVAVSYSNYGTNGGQNRQTTNSGIMGRNKACSDGRSALMGQAKLPLPLLNHGAFRPPLFRQEDLLPLSRLPRTSTHAWTQSGFISYLNQMKCPEPNKVRQIQNPVKTNIRPTAILTIGQQLVEPFEIRQVIENPITINVTSGMRSMDITEKQNSDINGRIQDTLYGNIRTNTGSTYRGSRSVQDLNPSDYVTDVTYSRVYTNKDGIKVHLPEKQSGKLPINENIINISAHSGININNGEPLKDNVKHNLIKPIPSHTISINKSKNIYARQEDPKKLELERNRPLATAKTNLGKGYGTDLYLNNNRNKKLKYTVRPKTGISGKGRKYKTEINKGTQFKSNNKKIDLLHKSNRTQGSRF